MIINAGLRRNIGKNLCQHYIVTPVDSTITIDADTRYCSSGSVEIDSVAAGAGIVIVNGQWRLR